jgi:hypothetical protein
MLPWFKPSVTEKRIQNGKFSRIEFMLDRALGLAQKVPTCAAMQFDVVPGGRDGRFSRGRALRTSKSSMLGI